MQLHSHAKRNPITLDDVFNAFRGMINTNTTKLEQKGFIFTLTNPVENVWFVHAHDTSGKQVLCAQADQYDL